MFVYPPNWGIFDLISGGTGHVFYRFDPTADRSSSTSTREEHIYSLLISVNAAVGYLAHIS